MARYKDYSYDQMKMIPVSFERQILPGSFEYSLTYLIDNELNLTVFDQHYCNDDNGRQAYDPRLLLKIVILAYSKGITSRRQIESQCRENITFMALAADTQPHFTTIADFISRSPEAIADLPEKQKTANTKTGQCRAGYHAGTKSGIIERMKRKIDSPQGRHIYS